MDRTRAVERRMHGIRFAIEQAGSNDGEFAHLWKTGGTRPTKRIAERFPALAPSEIRDYAAYLGLAAASAQASTNLRKITSVTPLIDRMDAMQHALDNAAAVLADHEARIKAYEDNWAAFTETPSAHVEPEML